MTRRTCERVVAKGAIVWCIVAMDVAGGLLMPGQGMTADAVGTIAKEARETIDATKRYSTRQKKAFERQAHEELRAVQKRIDILHGKMRSVSTMARAEFQKSIDELERKKASAKSKLDDLRSATDTKWGEVRASLAHALDELKHSYQKALAQLP